MKFKESFPKQLEMSQLEMLFKQLYAELPERHLDIPHSASEVCDVIALAEQKAGEPLSIARLDSRLQEEDFFRNKFDTELYQHLRYLPVCWHSHSFFEVVCVAAGSCTNYILDQTLQMQTGDVCIIAPGTQHAISAFSDDCIVINILLRTSTFEEAFWGILSDSDILSDFFMRTLYHSKTHPYLFFCTGGDQELLDFVLYAYQEFLGNHQYKERFLNNIISAFFIILLRNHGSNVIVPDTAAPGNDENTIFILKYIQEHFCSVTLKELSDFFNYSERQLQRIIKSSTGMSFSENILKLKMNRAARLLANSDLSIACISQQLGYSDPGNFRSVFKKYHGMAPADYRRQA